MKTKLLIKKTFLFFLFMLPISIMAQSVNGKVTDVKGNAIPFATVVEKGTTNGTTTDDNGAFTLNVSKLPATISISSVGYVTKTVTTNDTVTVILQEENVGLDEVVLTGNRAKPRTILDSSVPIDNISVKDMASSGQATVDQMLTYKIPSYNSSNQTISDATAHFDPADLRGLGPSRTLVLVNGKRKNQSALVYINDTPGKGEVGTDMKSIPTAAIDHIEVLRDGASAQYGSDAIAGVVNIVLKKNVDFTQVNVNSGVTSKGDGFSVGADLNTTLQINGGGFINLSLGAYRQSLTNRAGTPGQDDLFGVGASDSWIQQNPDLGMTIGQPEITKGEVFYNSEIPFKNGKGKFYSYGGLVFRQGKSFALYRTPYWVTDPFNLLHNAGDTYQGFQPSFETNINDNTNVAGFSFDANKYKIDISATYGRNAVDYTVANSLNPDLGAASPTSFDVGAYRFSNIIGNVDVSRSYGDFSWAMGGEIKSERFIALAGQEESYIGGGVQSFPGVQPSNAVNATRSSAGAYLNVDWDISKAFLISGAVRYENFSDFGDNTSWKVSSRYKISDETVIRGSYSTGFRAPALHQIYLSNIQTLVSGGTISNQGTFNNVSPVLRDGLGVPQLHAETSDNFSAGFTYKPSRDVNFSIDLYNVKVHDRVLFTGEIGFDGDDLTTNPVEEILNDFSVTSIKFFINAVNTKTNGVDFVANFKNFDFAAGKLDVNIAANFNKTSIVGAIGTPAVLAANGYNIFNRKEQSRITSSRPKTKIIVGLDYAKDKFTANLNNTYFGDVTWQHASDPTKDQTFSGKVVTDLILSYAFTDKVSASFTVNNLLNVYPDVIDIKGDVVTDLGGRFKYPWEVNQFGFNGTIFKAGLTYKF
ncbi:MAG: TonB-dependent receptor [Flavobacteriales bacterium]|nr:TonB-dependent receptor [Flavobacteriales bacterium]